MSIQYFACPDNPIWARSPVAANCSSGPTESFRSMNTSALPLTANAVPSGVSARKPRPAPGPRSEAHASELQSRSALVCRLLLEQKTGTRSEADSSDAQSRSAIGCRLLLEYKKY